MLRERARAHGFDQANPMTRQPAQQPADTSALAARTQAERAALPGELWQHSRR